MENIYVSFNSKQSQFKEPNMDLFPWPPVSPKSLWICPSIISWVSYWDCCKLILSQPLQHLLDNIETGTRQIHPLIWVLGDVEQPNIFLVSGLVPVLVPGPVMVPMML